MIFFLIPPPRSHHFTAHVNATVALKYQSGPSIYHQNFVVQETCLAKHTSGICCVAAAANDDNNDQDDVKLIGSSALACPPPPRLQFLVCVPMINVTSQRHSRPFFEDRVNIMYVFDSIKKTGSSNLLSATGERDNTKTKLIRRGNSNDSKANCCLIKYGRQFIFSPVSSAAK